MKINPTLFLTVRFKFFNSGIGSAIITISSVMLKAAPENTIPVELMHFPGILRFHNASMGTH
jgi:hypothetical protein